MFHKSDIIEAVAWLAGLYMILTIVSLIVQSTHTTNPQLTMILWQSQTHLKIE